MTLDQAKEVAAEHGICNRDDLDGIALQVLASEVERLQAIISDASDLVSRYRASSGNEYFYDVRGRELARVLGRQA